MSIFKLLYTVILESCPTSAQMIEVLNIQWFRRLTGSPIDILGAEISY